MASIILIRGGGDLATGVAIRLIRCGLRVAVTELSQPLAVRRTVSFAEAVYSGEVSVEGITARRVDDPSDTLRILSVFGRGHVPVIVDPECSSAKILRPVVIVDGRMLKRSPEPIGYYPMLYIGLGPGFIAGQNCQAVVETRRSHTLGRVYWQGGTTNDTGTPEGIQARVIRAPADGLLIAHKQIGDLCENGEPIAEIQATNEIPGIIILSPFRGILRGLIHPGSQVTKGLKIGDIDPNNDPSTCTLVSDKALAISGGVLEAILSHPEVRNTLWT